MENRFLFFFVGLLFLVLSPDIQMTYANGVLPQDDLGVFLPTPQEMSSSVTKAIE